jgi:hypothetical protein
MPTLTVSTPLLAFAGTGLLLLLVAALPVREGSESRLASAIAQRLTIERRVVLAGIVVSAVAGIALAHLG